MFSSLTWLAAREHNRDLHEAAALHRRRVDSRTPVTRVTIRHAAAADSDQLHELAELDSMDAPSGPILGAEVDGRLRAALPLDGGAAIADPFHSGRELVELLRLRAGQLARA